MRGYLVRGDRGDRAFVAALATLAPGAADADWVAIDVGEGEGGEGRGVVVGSAALTPQVAAALRARGHALIDVDDDRAVGAPVFHNLALAFPLVARADVDVDVVEAVFVVAPAEAARLCERLLLLGKDDARVCDVDGVAAFVDVDAPPLPLWVRVAQPPVWLLLWAADADRRSVRCFVRRAGESAALYTALDVVHPLADTLATALAADERVGLLGPRTAAGVDARHGHLVSFRALAERPLSDVVRGAVSASAFATGTSAPVARTFAVPLRLAPDLRDEVDEPELFVIDEAGLDALDAFAAALSTDELSRLLLSRLTSERDGRARVVVRELVRPGTPRLGARLQTVLQQRGYVRVPGFDALHLPPGRRFVPTLKRDELRRALGVEDAAVVVVDEDASGFVVWRIPRLDDEPMAKLVSYVATAHRVQLDRLLETAVLTFPRLHIERRAASSSPSLPLPPPPKKVTPPPPPKRAAPASTSPRRRRRRRRLRRRRLRRARRSWSPRCRRRRRRRNRCRCGRSLRV